MFSWLPREQGLVGYLGNNVQLVHCTMCGNVCVSVFVGCCHLLSRWGCFYLDFGDYEGKPYSSVACVIPVEPRNIY